jgi:CRISPR/Cas system-associated endoribonuclease Cas2
MPKRRIYIIAYDSPSGNRRAKMLERVQGFGIDPQLSFHECCLSRGETRELWGELLACSDPARDKLLLLRLDPRNATWRLGKPAASGQNTSVADTITYIG